MPEPKFTPGPWETGIVDRENNFWEIEGPNGEHIAQCHFCGGNLSETEFANARLIAAAPEMYELLQETFGDECDDDCGSACDIAEECEVRRARILIAQINGEEENHE